MAGIAMEDSSVNEHFTMDTIEEKNYRKSLTINPLILENDDECDYYEVNLNKFLALRATGSSDLGKDLSFSESFKIFDAITCNLPMVDELLNSALQTKKLDCSNKACDNILMIDAELFSWETPLESTYAEFKRLSSIDDEVFSYNVLMSYTEDELLLLWPIIESKGLTWTTIEAKDGKLQI